MEQVGEVADHVVRYAGMMPCRRSGMTGYTVRVMPHHPTLSDARELAMIRWA